MPIILRFQFEILESEIFLQKHIAIALQFDENLFNLKNHNALLHRLETITKWVLIQPYFDTAGVILKNHVSRYLVRSIDILKLFKSFGDLRT